MMNRGDKIVCIDSSNIGSSFSDENITWLGTTSGLTLNKFYEVLYYDDLHINVINDFGEKYTYLKGRFKLLAEFRNNRINEILNDE